MRENLPKDSSNLQASPYKNFTFLAKSGYLVFNTSFAASMNACDKSIPITY